MFIHILLNGTVLLLVVYSVAIVIVFIHMQHFNYCTILIYCSIVIAKVHSEKVLYACSMNWEGNKTLKFTSTIWLCS